MEEKKPNKNTKHPLKKNNTYHLFEPPSFGVELFELGVIRHLFQHDFPKFLLFPLLHRLSLHLQSRLFPAIPFQLESLTKSFFELLHLQPFLLLTLIVVFDLCVLFTFVFKLIQDFQTPCLVLNQYLRFDQVYAYDAIMYR